MLIPAVYTSYVFGKYLYNQYMEFKAPEQYRRPQPTVKDKIKQYVGNVVDEVLKDKEVEQAGLDFLSKLLTDPQTHEAGLILLTQVLKDPRFVAETNVFGVDLIGHVIKQPKLLEDFTQLVIKALQSEDVKKETVEILRYITQQKQSEDILALYFETVFQRKDMTKSVTDLLTTAAVDTLDRKVTLDKFGNFVIKVAGNPKVKSGIYDSFVYKPVKSFFSFGMFSGDQEQQQPTPTGGQVTNMNSSTAAVS